MAAWLEERKEVLETSQKTAKAGLVAATAGNVSVRIKDAKEGAIAITPSSLYYDELAPEDIQIISFNGQTLNGSLRPSVETALHINIYKARESINAVVHIHSPYASAFAASARKLPAILEDQASFLGGEISVAKDAPCGSEELASNVVDALGGQNAVILAHHGAIGVGRTARQAYEACLTLEKTAKAFILSECLGGAKPLPEGMLVACQEYFKKTQQ